MTAGASRGTGRRLRTTQFFINSVPPCVQFPEPCDKGDASPPVSTAATNRVMRFSMSRRSFPNPRVVPARRVAR